MKKKRQTQDNYIRRTGRYPPDMFDELTKSAKENGRSFNAEVLARLSVDQISELRQEVAELKRMLREVLDRLPS